MYKHIVYTWISLKSELCTEYTILITNHLSLFQGWVSLLTVLLVVRPWIQPGGTVSAQLWEPERRAKSLGFLGRGEDGQIREVEDNGIEGDVEKKETEKKKAILNVSDKDSPYALIDKYFPERDSYFYQNRKKFLHEFRESGGASGDIGGLDPSEVRLDIFLFESSFRIRDLIS